MMDGFEWDRVSSVEWLVKYNDRALDVRITKFRINSSEKYDVYASWKDYINASWKDYIHHPDPIPLATLDSLEDAKHVAEMYYLTGAYE